MTIREALRGMSTSDKAWAAFNLVAWPLLFWAVWTITPA